MIVYVEYVIIDNFIVNYLLIDLALHFTKSNKNRVKIAISSLVGTCVAILLPLLSVDKGIKLIIKIALGLAMVFISEKFTTLKRYLITLNYFILFTFLFGGSIYFALGFLQIDYSLLYGTSSVIPLGLIILAVVSMYKILKGLFGKLFEKKLIYPFIVKCELYNMGHKIMVDGFIDSGNNVVYKDNRGVSVLSSSLYKKMYIQGFLDNLTSDTIIINTVNGECKMNVYEIDKIVIYYRGKVNIIYKAIIATCRKPILQTNDYDLILSSEFANC